MFFLDRHISLLYTAKPLYVSHHYAATTTKQQHLPMVKKWPLLCTSSTHLPSGRSPHMCTVMKGQFCQETERVRVGLLVGVADGMKCYVVVYLNEKKVRTSN